MYRFRAITAATLSLLLITAAVTARDTNYDKNHDFSTYQHFSWLEPDRETTVVLLGGSTFDPDRLRWVHEQIEQAIEQELGDKGIEISEPKDADFLVRFHTSVDQRFELHTDYVYRRPRFRGPAIAHIESYDEGTLVVDMIDAESERLVWRSTVTRSIEVRNLAKTINKAVARALRKFPPSSR